MLQYMQELFQYSSGAAGYVAIGIFATVLASIFTMLCRKLAFKTGFLDIPACEMHKQHKKATPLLGGIAMLGAWGLTLAAGFALAGPLAGEGPLKNITSGLALIRPDIIVMILCAAASVALGTYDDRHSMKAWKKLIFQILIASAAALWGGVSITLFVANPVFSFVVTVFWFVLIFNAINFFDNMDGLASGTAMIAFAFFAIAAAVNHQYFIASLGAAAAGSALGFWFFNRSPASIFMGDGGSHFLGFMLAFISAKVTYYTPGVSTTKFTLLIPLFILAIPLLDTLTVVLIRLHNHKPVYIGDHNHISHRFWHMGMSRAEAVSMVHMLSLISGLGALPLLWGDIRTCIVLIIQGLIIYLLVFFLQYTVYKSIKAKDNGEEKK